MSPTGHDTTAGLNMLWTLPALMMVFLLAVCFVSLQTQRQLQHSLEVHQRYITSLMEQEGLAHRIPEMSAALAKGPAAAAVPGSVVSEAMPAQHAADSMQHQQLKYHNHNGISSLRAAAAPVVHPSLPQYHPTGSNGMHMGNLQQQHHQQQSGLGMQQHVGHSRSDRNPGHLQQQQQQHHGLEDFLIPGDLVPHPQQHGSMGTQLTSAAAAAAAAAAAEHGGDLLGMSGPSGDMFLLDHDHHDHDLHFMLTGMPGEEELAQGHPDKRQRLLGPDDL